MKFTYEFRTSDNVHHEGVISAVDRDAAYAELKARGIRPGRVAEAPGFFNKLFGRGKRWLTIGLLAAVLLVVGIWYLAAREELVVARVEAQEAREEAAEAKEIAFTFENTTRRQVIGDAAIIEKGIRSGWEDVFPYEGERFLASFAIPGVPAGLRNTTEVEVRAALARSAEESIGGRRLSGLEERQIAAIVEGMKSELRNFLASGKHTIVEYGRRLVARQEQEIAYYNRAKTEIDSLAKSGAGRDELYSLWEKRNAELRRIGVRLVALPED